MTETNQALLPLTKVLEELTIPYRIVGAVASSVQGLVRATLDIDMVVDVLELLEQAVKESQN